MRTGYLILENGQVFEGERRGAAGETCGELVFTTGMTGYLETLTDPGFYGQIVMQTFPLIGNYGLIPEDFQSERPHLKAYVVRELCDTPSNFRSEGQLEDYLKEAGVITLTGVDTRELTRIVRENGVMNALISDKPTPSPAQQEQLRTYTIKNAIAGVTCAHSFHQGAGRRVVLCDYGAKAMLRQELIHRGCEVITVPGNTPAAEILALKPAGILLSNGPGDPAENTGIIQQLRFLFDTGIPIFGVCLGHQLMALAHGGKTRKMKYGHRGANQPAQDIDTGRVYITTQNHGYCVVGESLGRGARMRFVNANDGTCEGVDYQSFPGFSVQFLPEACGGPLDMGFLYDRFFALMEGGDANAAR